MSERELGLVGCVPKATQEGTPSTRQVAEGMVSGTWVPESRLWQRDGTLQFHHGLLYLLNFVPSTFEQLIKAEILKLISVMSAAAPAPDLPSTGASSGGRQPCPCAAVGVAVRPGPALPGWSLPARPPLLPVPRCPLVMMDPEQVGLAWVGRTGVEVWPCSRQPGPGFRNPGTPELVLHLGAFLSSPVGCGVGGSRGWISSPTSCDLTATPHDTADVPLPRPPSRAPKLGMLMAGGPRSCEPPEKASGYS